MNLEITTTSLHINTCNKKSFNPEDLNGSPPTKKSAESRLYSGATQTFKESNLKRKRPQISMINSGVFKRVNGKIVGRSTKHNETVLFHDSEIIEVVKPVKKTTLKQRHCAVDAKFTASNKAVILQQALRSCGQTCVAMRALDLAVKPNLSGVLYGDLSNNQRRKALIEELDLEATQQTFSASKDYLDQLKDAINEFGPAIIAISSEIFGHCIIVDKVKETTVEIRDPYHGWKIEITKEAFMKRHPSTEILFANKKVN